MEPLVEHKPRIGYRDDKSAIVECTCGIRFEGNNTDTKYAWHLVEVQDGERRSRGSR